MHDFRHQAASTLRGAAMDDDRNIRILRRVSEPDTFPVVSEPVGDIRRVAIVDTETTGTDPLTTPRWPFQTIVAAAAMVLVEHPDGNIDVSRFVTLSQPDHDERAVVAGILQVLADAPEGAELVSWAGTQAQRRSDRSRRREESRRAGKGQGRAG